MKKRLVLIVLLFFAGSFTLLAQINKTDTAASKKEAEKKPISQTQPDTSKSAKAKTPDKPDKKALDKAAKAATQKREADSLANVKALKLAVQKKQADSIASLKNLKLAAQKKQADSLATAKTLKLTVEKNKKDSIAAAKTSGIAAQKSKKDSAAAAKVAKPVIVPKVKADSVASVKQPASTVLKTKPDTTGSAKVTKPVVTAPKSKADSIASVKPPIQAIQKTKTDTTASKLISDTKPDTSHTAKSTPPVLVKSKIDTTQAPQKKLSKKELAKLNAKSGVPDSLASKSKVKPLKPKSAKEIKREAMKNDVNNMSEKDLTKLAFQHMAADSAFKNPRVMHTDISYTNARPLPLTEPNPLNIKFFHRYWRDIDLQDPKNKKFAQYHADLINSLLAAIKRKELKAYSPIGGVPENPTGDMFTVTVPYDQLMVGLSDTAVVNIIDKDGNITGTKQVPNPFTPEKISGYRIKEDVFYDKTRSRSITRIIGIAPLVKLTLSSGEVISIQPLCWLRFKDTRKVLVTIDVDPTKKIGDSMDDVFLQRRFYGKIVQESNPDGKRIKDYKTEVPDQDVEAQRMEKKVVAFKKGSWNYTVLNEEPPQDPLKTKTVVKAAAKPPKKQK